MNAISSVADAFGAFATSLVQHRSTRIDLIGRLSNGFEGWLKLEFFAWLVEQGLVPGDDVGLECKAPLDRRRQGVDRDVKCCDLWMRALPADRYHYVELKAPFCNANTGKMLTGAGYDLWYVSRLRKEVASAATGSLIVFGVGFGATEWETAREAVRSAAELEAGFEVAKEGELSSAIRWGVWTHEYC